MRTERMAESVARSIVATSVVLATVGVVRAGTSQYVISDLTELARPAGVQQCEATSINEAGQIVGFEVLPEFLEQAIFWDADGSVALLPMHAGDNSTRAAHIAPDGTILGVSTEVTVQQQGKLLIIFEDQKATIWQSSAAVDLNAMVTSGAEGVQLHVAQDVNAAGQIVGFAGLIEGPPFFSNGFLFDDGAVTDLGMLQRPRAINDRMQIVGSTVGGQADAYLWDAGVLVNLHDHPAIGGVTSRVFDISNNSIIVGEAQFSIAGPEEPTAWIDLVPTRLVPDVNRPQGIATAINSHDQIVGYYNDLDDPNSGFIGTMWEADGERIELLDLIPQDLEWTVLLPADINDTGQIVGVGMRNGELGHGFVMTPIVPADLNADGSVNAADLALLLGAWGPNPGHVADLNEDGAVNAADLALLLGTWDS